MASYGSVPLDGTKQVAYEVESKGLPHTGVIVGQVIGGGKEGAKGPILPPGPDDDDDGSTPQEKERARWEKIVQAGASRAPPALVPCLQAMAPAFGWVAVGFKACLPYYIKAFGWVVAFAKALPVEELTILGGLILCFFGG